MRFLGLQLANFRNFAREHVELRPRLNFFVGDNGQGKTNLVEAAHLLCKGTSFRAADPTSLVRSGNSAALIRARICKRELDFDVHMVVEAGKKSASINGKKTTAAGLMSQFPCVLFSPESLSVVKEGPDQRRNLVDELMVTHEPRKADLQREFQKALRSRNRLLRNLSEGLGPRRELEDSLESLDSIYFLLATHLTEARLSALREIRFDFQNAVELILGDAAHTVEIDYLVSGQSAWNWGESQIFDALRNRHRELRMQEINSGVSLVGPHKHDIKLLFDGNDSRFYCSQGQSRALILALKIAQIVYHHRVHQTYPVLLLDDVLSELDVKKRVNLMKFLEAISAQILITATDLTWPEHFGFDRNSVFTVTSGHVGRFEQRPTV